MNLIFSQYYQFIFKTIKDGYSKRFEVRSLFLLLLLLVLVYISYINIDKCQFIQFDDPGYIIDNFEQLNGITWHTVSWAFSTFNNANWHPITWLSHAFDCWVFGLDPAGHHLMNLFFHSLNTVLLYFLILGLTGARWRSFLVSLLFAVHPLHVESVAWVSERKDVISTTFLLICLLFYTRYVSTKKIRYYSLSLSAFVFGLMSKPMLVTAPVLMLLLDYWPLGRIKRDLRSIVIIIAEKIPFLALSVAVSYITLVAQKAGGAILPFANLSLPLRIENALVAYITYLKKMIYPLDLCVMYPHPWYHPGVLLLVSTVLFISISILAIVWRNKARWFLFGWGWYVVSLVPVIGIIQVGSQWIADRYTYMSLTGIFICIAWGIAELIQRKSVLTMVFIPVLAGASIFLINATQSQVDTWRNNPAILNQLCKVAPNGLITTAFKGFVYFQNNNMPAAYDEFLAGADVSPENGALQNNLGQVFIQQKNYTGALAKFRKAYKLDSKLYTALYNCGIVWFMLENNDSAEIYLKRCLDIRPLYIPAIYWLGVIYQNQHDYRTAVRYYDQITELSPNHWLAYHNAGVCYGAMNETQRSLQNFLKSIQINPIFPEAYNNLGVLLVNMGQTGLAAKQFERALQFKPDYDQARYNLTKVCEKSHS